MSNKFSIPFFSIITPVHNGEKYINNFLSALLKQTFANWELIVVNDQSTDNTHSLWVKSSCLDMRIKYFSSYPETYIKDNVMGPYAPRNFGIDQAMGDYLCFLDIDDYWLPNKLMADYNQIHKNNTLNLLYSNCFLFTQARKCLKRIDLSLLPPKMQVYFANPIPNLTACLSRSALGQIRFEPIGHEDYVFWFLILRKIPPSSIYKHSALSAVHLLSSSTLSGNKFTVLKWWLACYKRFGYSLPLGLILLSVRIFMYFLENVLYKLGFGKVDSFFCSPE